MVEEKNLVLPEDKKEADQKTFTEEKRGPSKEGKELIKKQAEFEYLEVESRTGEKEEEKKNSLKEKIFQWILILLSILFLAGLYYFLLA